MESFKSLEDRNLKNLTFKKLFIYYYISVEKMLIFIINFPRFNYTTNFKFKLFRKKRYTKNESNDQKIFK